MPRARKHNLRRSSANRQIGNSDLRSQIENPRPMRSSVERLKNTALIVGSIRVPQSAHIHDVRIARINHNSADVPRIFEANVRPGCAAVGGFVNAVAEGKRGANVTLAGSSINCLRVRRSHGQSPDRACGLPVENRRPDCTRVGCLPDSSVDRAEIKSVGIPRHASHRRCATAAEWADQAPFETV